MRLTRPTLIRFDKECRDVIFRRTPVFLAREYSRARPIRPIAWCMLFGALYCASFMAYEGVVNDSYKFTNRCPRAHDMDELEKVLRKNKA